ncbi:MFS transporter [Actinocorallia sp. A-T 12471]|uniref:MFS transporter n=1 Tax=Actinocorallia sp. A-T 12471 TaxID=3089813 RepID=UPI0029D29ED4|nr:MFS transporter [Actinocorallia sp. A-T 12471]MDX6742426.1 MFS transporter [Actinocorallia sp. A-T 12471]
MESDLKTPSPGLLALLSANRAFRLLWLGNLVSVCGGWFSAVAVFAMVYAHGGGPLAAGATLALRYLPGLLVGPWGGVLADRADRRAVMLGCDAVLAVLALAFLLADGPATLWLVYPLTLLSASVGYVFQAARAAWMPSLVRADEYVLYSAAVQVNGMVFQAVGGLAGAAVIGIAGWRWAFAVNAASFVLSFALTARVTSGSRRGGGARGTWLAALREGLAAARHSRVVSALLWLEAAFCLGLGGTVTAMTYLALHVHDLGDGGTGWFYAVQGTVGAVVLVACSGRLQRAAPATRLRIVGLSCLAEGVCTALLGLPSLPVLALLLWGAAAASDVVYGPTAVAALLAEAPDAVRGRVMALWSAVATASLTVSSAVSGVLLTALGHRLLPVLLGAVMAASGIAWLLSVGRVARPVTGGRRW